MASVVGRESNAVFCYCLCVVMIVRSTHIASYFIQDAADLHKHTREGGAVGLIYSGSQEQNHHLFFFITFSV